jgi:glucan phosphoethanolaminetransferase (alkaline phosphatase superfamily)
MLSPKANALRGLGAHFVAWLLVAEACLVGLARPGKEDLLLALGIALLQGAVAALSTRLRDPLRCMVLVAWMAPTVLLLGLLLLHGFYIRKGGIVSADALRAIGQTDLREAMRYLERLAGWRQAGLSALAIALLAATFPRTSGPETTSRRRALAVALPAVGLAMSCAAFALGGARPVLVATRWIRDYRHEAHAFRTLLEQRKARPAVAASSEFDGNLVVVLGESTNRDHLGIYGYFRDTTPKLVAQRKDLLVFRDVISPHSHTDPALLAALGSDGTPLDQQSASAGALDVLSLARGAGFVTSWLSNQNEYGVWDNGVSLLAKSADHWRFFSPALGESFERSVRDEAMLPDLRAALAGPAPRKLIFVHLFTDHWPYCANYPPFFQRFTEPLAESFFGREKPFGDDLNCYDNGILYLDWLLDRVLATAGGSSQPTAVLYLSDHGEAPELGTDHSSSQHSSYHLEIPLIFWANAEYARKYPEKMAAARSHLDAPYSSGSLYHSLADLLAIREPTVRLEDSLFSESFQPRPRSALDGKIRYDRWSAGNDYRENGRANVRSLGNLQARVWADRIDSFGALLEAKRVFQGVEMDVNFEGGPRGFAIFHPPGLDTGLDLRQMLLATKDRPQLRYWFGWKNASRENLAAALAELERLDGEFHLHGRVLVETSSEATFDGVAEISRAGFEHGYYLPTDEIVAVLESHRDAEAHALARRIEKDLRAGQFTAITFDWSCQPFVERWLASLVHERDLHLYSRDLSLDVSASLEAPAEIRLRLADLRLKALLVVFPSVFKI